MPISTKPGDIAFASILSGAYASAAIALFFLVADALGGRILYTPSLMGQVVLFDTGPADVTAVRLDAFALFSLTFVFQISPISSFFFQFNFRWRRQHPISRVAVTMNSFRPRFDQLLQCSD